MKFNLNDTVYYQGRMCKITDIDYVEYSFYVISEEADLRTALLYGSAISFMGCWTKEKHLEHPTQLEKILLEVE